METIDIYLEQYSKTSMKLRNDNFSVIVDRPKEKGGSGEGLMGGQYLLIGIAGCFCSNLFAAAETRSIKIEGLNVKVTAAISDDLPKRFTGVSLSVSYAECSDENTFKKLLIISERACISMNTVKNGITINVLKEKLQLT